MSFIKESRPLPINPMDTKNRVLYPLIDTSCKATHLTSYNPLTTEVRVVDNVVIWAKQQIELANGIEILHIYAENCELPIVATTIHLPDMDDLGISEISIRRACLENEVQFTIYFTIKIDAVVNATQGTAIPSTLQNHCWGVAVDLTGNKRFIWNQDQKGTPLANCFEVCGNTPQGRQVNTLISHFLPEIEEENDYITLNFTTNGQVIKVVLPVKPTETKTVAEAIFSGRPMVENTGINTHKSHQ